MKHVIGELDQLRRRTRMMLITQRLARVLTWVIGVSLVLVLIDYSLRLPSALRLLLLLAGVAALGVAIARYVRDAVRFRPTLTQLALRVERAIPSVSGRLASGVEFAASGLDQTNALAQRSIREVESRLSGESVTTILKPARMWRDVGIVGGLAVIVLALAVSFPAGAGTGIARLLLPYGSAQWPARTAVESLMGDVLVHDGVHPRGQALALRARNLTKDDASGRVDAHYRLRRDDSFGSWQRAVLTDQGAGIHERLVDTNAQRIEVYFTTEDARTSIERIDLVPPPAVLRATVRVEPPAYAAGRTPAFEADLGPGSDERAVTEEASLGGSTATLRLELNKPLPVPAPGAERNAWLRETLPWPAELGDETLPAFSVGSDADASDRRHWNVTWTLTDTRSLAMSLVDEYGLANTDPVNYRIKVVADLPPTVTITEPSRDETVLPSALVGVSGEAKDDVAVSRIGLTAEVRRASRADGSTGSDAAPEMLEFTEDRTVDAMTAGIEADLDLTKFDLVEGDVVLLRAVADDVYEVDGVRHETATSPVRRLRITSELDFAAQLRRQLSAVRQNAIRVEAQQAELQDDMRDTGVQSGMDRAQAQVSERIATERSVIEDLQEQLERNRLDDTQLEELLQQSSDLLDYAGRAANKAVEAMESARRSEPSGGRPDSESRPEDDETPNPESEAATRDAADAQQEVRDELTDLIELLDRDEDTWIVQRQLEGLLEAQAELGEATNDLAQETLGESMSDLTPAELSELERIVQRQRELRDEARRLIEEMRRRASALDEVDPQSASGMRSAAETGERREVDRDMENAAQQAEENRLQAAGAAQQASTQTLERMLEDLHETQQAKTEELLRQLASLIESIDRLIVVQENELIALATAQQRDVWGGRDRAMIRLNQNTESVASEARAAGQPARRIARALDRAADAQGAAVTALRAKPVDGAAAQEAEDRSLTLLKEAKQLAEEMEEETQEDQVEEQRQALIEAYRALAEKQIVVRGQTLELTGIEELSRRQLVEARRIGNAQDSIRTALSDLEKSTTELVDSEVFSFVHRLIDGWSRAVSESLWEGTIDVNTTDRQEMIADSIARQIEALEESASPPDTFAEDSGGGGGGGNGPPPLIPPPAEIKRLHGLQEQVYNQTKSIDRRDDLPAGARRQRVREMGKMQRDLMELGERMLEKLQGGAPAAPPGLPGLPGSSPDPLPPDTPREAPEGSPAETPDEEPQP